MSAETKEIRTILGDVEWRAAPEGSKSPGTLVGYAAVYESFSEDLGFFREKLAPGCFDRALKTSDVRGLKNHDPNLLLGRNISGTMRLATDEIGLRYEIDLPDTQTGRDTAEEVRRKDMSGCSFSFTTSIDEWDYSGETPLRTVREVRELFDVGPVTYPAYRDTKVALRSLQDDKTRRQVAETPAPSKRTFFPALEQARLRLLEV